MQDREKNTDKGSSYKMDSNHAHCVGDATHISDNRVPERGPMVPTPLSAEKGDSVFREKSSYVDSDYLEVYEPVVLQPIEQTSRRVGASPLETCLIFLLEMLYEFVGAYGAKKID